MAEPDPYSALANGARLLAMQRLLVALMAERLGCSPEVADARFQEEWENCFLKMLEAVPLPETSAALRDEWRRRFHQEKGQWLDHGR